MKKSQLPKRLLLHAEFRVKALLGIPGKCTFGSLSIVLPSEHVLPRSLKEHPRYDRFLPYLASKLPAGSTVIDVGANCGDTLAAMLAANHSLGFACIEADDAFFSYLEQNIARIQRVLPSAEIKAIKALVGKEVSKAQLRSSKGTAHAVASETADGQLARTLDDLAREFSLQNVSLLKSDVDGFDYDVLNSAEGLIREQGPAVFFECYCDKIPQREGYKQTLRMLQAARYEHWAIFDNFGELMLRTQDVAQIEQLIDYCWRETTGLSTRTINYLDILGAPARHAALLDSAVSGYATLNG